MNTTTTRTISRLLLAAATAGTIALGAASSVSASTEPPTDASAAADAPPPTAGEPSSPEAAAFCAAYIGVEAAGNSEDPTAIETAIGAAMEAAPEDAAPLLETLVGAFQESGGEGPEFAAAYTPVIDWLKANCGYPELNVSLSEYAFGGVPPELSAGPHIVSAANIGEEVHEFLVMRINDDVTLSVEELLALPEEEAQTMTTFAGIAFAFPGEVGYTVLDLTPGRYVALCFLPEGATPEVISQLPEGPPDSAALASAPPEVVAVMQAAPHFTHGMVQEFTVS